MKGKEENWSDAAAVAYINICLTGRAARIARKWNTIREQEQLILNKPVYDTDDSEEGIDQLIDDNACFDGFVVDKLLLAQAMANLKPKEAEVIVELFWNQKRISQLSRELQVSRKTVYRTKKIALDKLRRFMDCS
jgi:DNA-directed RNA polymerase specialized sigma24 family protein